MKTFKMGIIGAGNMGEALIKGILAGLRTAKITVSDVSGQRLKYLQKRYRIALASSNVDLVKKNTIILLAVKPQNIQNVLTEIAGFLNDKKLLISIAAGITTKAIEKTLKKKIPLIRIMPNIPALAGKGVSAICAGRFAKQADKKTAAGILSSIGETVEVKEDLMDVVTAVSGSGPAYFFFLVEMLIEAGIKQGLSEEVARELSVRTMEGAAELLLKTGQPPDILRQKVASRGGATEAAFGVFEKSGLDKIFQEGIKAAIKRSKELSCLY